ncbi:MAG: hydrogenase nickel incorporation protein HypB [Bacteroidales bacterium]|nr:hydrogenase nickel incorporation protein HypB [Bacteroidales bacterium]
MCQTCGCEGKGSMVTIGRPLHFQPQKLETIPEKFRESDSPSPLAGIRIDRPAVRKGTGGAREIEVVENLLGDNDAAAAENRKFLNERKIFSLNLMGSPGCGKTTFIIKTIESLKEELEVFVIEGDQFGSLDADRISATGAKVIQINTGNGCHLDARSVGKAIIELEIPVNSLLFIENVGNLVCPALFDLGEHLRIVMLSVTEGDDKPVKYAPMFHGAAMCVINKTDLLDYVDFDIEKAKDNLRKINGKQKIMTLSASRGKGMEDWLAALRNEIRASKS